MPSYKLEILVSGQDKGARDLLLDLHGGLGSLNIALGNLVSDGLKAATGALIDFGKRGLDVATDYQSSMALFSAVSGASAADMKRVGDMAAQLGGDMTLPATSAGDAAHAMTELAKAGLSVNDVLAAGKGTLQLAAAGQLDEARAAEIAANALNSFGLSGDKATMVADLFAATANRSSVEVEDIAQSFTMASAVFSSFQGKVVGSEEAMKELATALALLGNAGIKGSDAGTSLKQMLMQLAGPSGVAKDEMKAMMYAAMGAAGSMEGLDKIIGGKAKARGEALGALGKANPSIAAMGDIAYDSAGKMRPLQDIIKLTALATKGMTDEQRNSALATVFGTDSVRAILKLMEAGPDAFKAMEGAISQQGAASALAAAQTKGLAGAWDGFQSTVDTTLLKLMAPMLDPLESGVRGLADALAAATPGITDFVTTGVLPAVTGFSQLLASFIAAPDKIGFLSGLISDLGGTLKAGLGSAFQFVVSSLPGWLDNLARWGAALVEWVAPYVPPLLGALGTLLGTVGQWFIDRGPELLGKLGEWGQKLVDWVAPMIPPLLGKAGELLGNLKGWILGQGPALTTSLGDWGATFLSWLPTYEQFKVSADAFMDGIWPWIKEKVPIFAENLGSWTTTLIEWIGPAFGKLIIAAGTGFGDFLGWITKDETGKSILSSLGTWTLAFITWAAVDLPLAILTALKGLEHTVWDELVRLWGNAFSEGSLGKSLVDGLIKGMGEAWGSITQWFSEHWMALLGAIPGLAPIMAAVNAANLAGAGVPGFASGVRNFGGGMALVGERGPELVNLASGSNVIPSGATRGLLSGGGGGMTQNITINVNGTSDVAATARAVRVELIKIGKRNGGLGGIFGGYA
jgi:hypothetical protein